MSAQAIDRHQQKVNGKQRLSDLHKFSYIEGCFAKLIRCKRDSCTPKPDMIQDNSRDIFFNTFAKFFQNERHPA
jgi:hypothetical protein